MWDRGLIQTLHFEPQPYCFRIEKRLLTRFPGFSDFKVVLVELLAMAWNMMTWDLLDCWLVMGFVL